MSKKQNRGNRRQGDEVLRERIVRVTIVTFVACVLVSVGFGLYYYVQSLNPSHVLCTEVGDAIPLLRELPALVEPVGLLLDDLPKIEIYLTKNLKKSVGQNVDFYLQIHAVPFDFKKKRRPDDPVLACQQEIYRQLVTSKYDLIGSEGFCGEVLSIDELDKDVVKDAVHLGHKVTPEAMERIHAMTVRDLPRWGALNFVNEHPTPSIGVERYSALYTHAYLNMTAERDTEVGGKWRRQAELLINLRSMIALARIFERLDTIKKKRAALVIGYGHKDELERCRKELGFGGKTVNAVPSWFH